MNETTNDTPKINTAIMITLVMFQLALGSLLTDLYVPAMPLMVQAFHVTPQLVQYTLTAYLFGYAAMQLVYGPISDKFGRRPIVIAGSAVAVLGLFLSIMPHASIYMFIFARLLQGSGMAACLSLSRAMISDCYKGTAFARISSYLSLVIGVFPAVAPFLGGQITHFFGWQMNFIMMAVLAAILLLLLILFLPETNFALKEKTSALDDYKHLLAHKHFYCYSLISGLSYATVMVYVMLLPFIAYAMWKMTPVEYGYLALAISLGLMAGKLLNVFLLKYLNVRGMICLGLGLMFGFSLLMVVMSFVPHLRMLELVLPLVCALTGAGMIFPNASSTVYAPFRHIAGSTSALYGGAQVMIAFIAQGVAGMFKEQHLGSLCWSFLLLAILSNIAFYILSTKND
jgi:DHA1 family bicyclomycin/chloramphenicol resistance-like MFS transporter